MRRILKLARVLRQGSGFIGREKENSENKAVGSNSDLIVPAILVILVGGLCFLTYKFADMIELFGGEQLLMTAVFLLVGIVGIVLTFLELINTMYMSSDLASLVVMPLSAMKIVGARLVNAARLQFLIAVGAIVPSLVGFGLATQAGVMFYLTGVLGIILVPLFSLFLAAILVIFIMTFVRMFRNRDVLAIIGVVIVFIALIAYTAVMNSGTTADELGNTVLTAMQGMSNFANALPVVPFLVQFYVTGDVLMLLAAIGVVLGALVVLIVFINVFYYRGAMAIHSGGKTRKVIKNFAEVTKKHSVLNALATREISTVFRTPAYYLYGWIITLFWPIVVIVPVLLRVNIGEMMASIMGAETPDVNGSAFGLVMVAAACVLSFVISVVVVGMNNFAYNSISRDGQSFFFDKIIPVSFKEQIKAKRNAALIVSLIGTTGYVMILSLIVIFVFKWLPFWALVPIIIISVATTILMNNLQVWFGSRRVNLGWTDEAAVGKSASAVLMIIAIVGLFAVPLALIFSLVNGVAPVVWIAGLVAFSLIGAVLSERMVLPAAARKMEEL